MKCNPIYILLSLVSTTQQFANRFWLSRHSIHGRLSIHQAKVSLEFTAFIALAVFNYSAGHRQPVSDPATKNEDIGTKQHCEVLFNSVSRKLDMFSYSFPPIRKRFRHLLVSTTELLATGTASTTMGEDVPERLVFEDPMKTRRPPYHHWWSQRPIPFNLSSYLEAVVDRQICII